MKDFEANPRKCLVSCGWKQLQRRKFGNLNCKLLLSRISIEENRSKTFGKGNTSVEIRNVARTQRESEHRRSWERDSTIAIVFNRILLVRETHSFTIKMENKLNVHEASGMKCKLGIEIDVHARTHASTYLMIWHDNDIVSLKEKI